MTDNQLKAVFDFIRTKLGMTDSNNDDDTDDNQFPELVRDITKEFAVTEQYNDVCVSYLYLSPLDNRDYGLMIGWNYVTDRPTDIVLWYKGNRLSEPEVCMNYFNEYKLALVYESDLKRLMQKEKALSFKIDRSYEEH